MRKNLIICDKCGIEEKKNCYWAYKITQVTIHCPLDGINGGNYKLDLCYKCRDALDNFLQDFLCNVQVCNT